MALFLVCPFHFCLFLFFLAGATSKCCSNVHLFKQTSCCSVVSLQDSSSGFAVNQPEIHKVSDIILWLLKTFGYSKKEFPASRLTRIHFHSLTYHIVGVVPDAWENSESAVAAGTQIAGRQACNTQRLVSEDVKLKIPETFRLHSNAEPSSLDEKRPVISWDLEGYHFVFSPVLVCQHPKRTVGLGDAISSTGLMYSTFKAKYRLP